MERKILFKQNLGQNLGNKSAMSPQIDYVLMEHGGWQRQTYSLKFNHVLSWDYDNKEGLGHFIREKLKIAGGLTLKVFTYQSHQDQGKIPGDHRLPNCGKQLDQAWQVLWPHQYPRNITYILSW